MLLESLLLTLTGVTPVLPDGDLVGGIYLAAAPVTEQAQVAQVAAPKSDVSTRPGTTSAPSAGAAGSEKVKQAELSPEVHSLVDRMQKFYENTSDFTARFEQTYTYKTFKRTQKSSGKVLFKKPGLMRWDYLKPSPRSFVLAGNKVYAHDPEARTLTVAAMDTSQLSVSVTFLFGKGKLQDEFDIRQEACASCKGTLLVLTPRKPDPRFREVRFEVDPKTAQVLASTVIDPDGSQNAIRFLDLKANVGIDREAFKLSPPTETQVIDYTRDAAAGKK